MKKYISVLPLLFLCAVLHSESVWTGNAAVGGSAEFPGSSESFRAASNSFPAGTILQVTNPRGGAMVNVTITGRLDTPGVFILIESSAALAIGLPTDHVLPVRVTPLNPEAPDDLSLLPVEEAALTKDPDYNPAAGLSEEPDEIRTAAVSDPELPEEVKSVEAVDEIEPETIITYELTEHIEAEETQAAVPADAVETVEQTGPVDPESSIFFLLPSDLRPPDSAGVAEVIPDTITEISEISESGSLSLTQYKRGDSLRYIQVGAYKNRVILEETARALKTRAPGYPLSIATESVPTGTVYKLLIGPLTPAETGIVLQTARTSAFPDAFPFSP